MPPYPASTIQKRSDWAEDQAGVVLVFCIVFIVGCSILSFIVLKAWRQRQAERAQWTVEEITEVNKR